MKKMKQPLIIIGGPTASGKSDVGVKLAKAIGGEIISADSMQVYKRMDIGTAKVTAEEMDGVKHYGIDVLEPSEDFNVTFFKNMAKKAAENIYKDGKVPIIVGGTGFYIQAFLYDIDFNESGDSSSNDQIRAQLQMIADEKGADFLHAMLREVDEKAAESIHPNNIKRVIRAIEYYRLTGQKISEHNDEQSGKESPYDYIYFALTDNRDILYERIDKRVDKMADLGLIEEVKCLKAQGLTRDMVSMQGIGYKEILDYLDGKISLDEALDIIKRESRRYAKRQLTWLRRERQVVWLDREKLGSSEAILKYMLDYIKSTNFNF